VRSAGGGVALAQQPVARAHFADAAAALQLEQDARADVRQRHTYSGSGPEFPQHRRAATTATSLWGDIHLRVEPCTDSVGFVPKMTTDATRRRSEALSTPLIKGLHGDAEIGGYINWRP
jgi:hypothetical protein